MPDESKSMPVMVKSLLKPEDFFYDAVYLLFSEERSKEKDYAAQIREGFKPANLVPRKLVVEGKAMVLQCDGYATVLGRDEILPGQDPWFMRFFMPASFNIAAGEVPPRVISKGLEGRVYVFN